MANLARFLIAFHSQQIVSPTLVDVFSSEEGNILVRLVNFDLIHQTGIRHYLDETLPDKYGDVFCCATTFNKSHSKLCFGLLTQPKQLQVKMKIKAHLHDFHHTYESR